MGQFKIYIKSKIIDIRLLSDLREEFVIVYEDNCNVDFILDEDVFTCKDNNIDFNISHWLDTIVYNDSIDINFSDLLIELLMGFLEYEEII